MNLDSNDIELIRTTVEAAVAKATDGLVKEATFKEFRDEVRAANQLFVQREVFQLEMKARDEEIDRLWKQVKANQNVLSKLWENTGIKIGAVLAIVLQAYELWRIFNP